MINKLTPRHSKDNFEDYMKYTIQCPCCGTILNFGKDDVYDVYNVEDGMCIHHEYIDCPECNEEIQLSDNEYYGY